MVLTPKYTSFKAKTQGLGRQWICYQGKKHGSLLRRSYLKYMRMIFLVCIAKGPEQALLVQGRLREGLVRMKDVLDTGHQCHLTFWMFCEEGIQALRDFRYENILKGLLHVAGGNVGMVLVQEGPQLRR